MRSGGIGKVGGTTSETVMSGAAPRPERRRARRAGRAPIAAALAATIWFATSTVVASGSAVPTSSGGGTAAAPVRVGAVPVLPAGARAIGPLPAATRLRIDVVLQPRDPAALARFATEVSTPGSPLFRHYLAPGQFPRVFGPTATAIAAVGAALRGRGLVPGPLSANHLVIPVTTTAGAAESAFSLQLRQYLLPSGRVAFANTLAPSVPAAVAGDVQAVVGLDTLAREHPASGGARPSAAQPGPQVGAWPNAGGPMPCTLATDTGAATANELASAYGFTGLYAAGDLGAGQTVALFELASYQGSDVATYQSCYGTSTSITNVSVDGGAGGVGSGTLEATTDIEDVIGLAPRAALDVYEAPNSSTGVVDNFNAIVNADTAKVISDSWGLCESLLGSGVASSENTLFQQAASQGQTVLVAVGDHGSSGCYQANSSTALAVEDPASQPYATAVGGTEFTSKTFTPPPPEVVWYHEPTNSMGGGGGISTLWPMPSWQAGPGVVSGYSSGGPCGLSSGYCRQVPDVSALAGSPYYAFYCTAGDCSTVGGWGYFWGTSFATPLWAALVALTNASCSTAPPVGFLNPRLYPLAASAAPPFHDVTSGDNDVFGTNGGDYPATSRYDMASGLGTPIATGGSSPGLASMLCSLSAGGPIVTSVAPRVGATAGGTSVTITGFDFLGTTVVDFGATAATGVTVVSATQITAVSPAEAAGTVNVTVRTATGVSATSPADRFTYLAPPPPPTVTGVTPGSGGTGGGGTVTVTGTNFVGGGTTVTFGGAAASNVVVQSAAQLTATVPAHAAGPVAVTATTAGGTSTQSYAQYLYLTHPSGEAYMALPPYRILDTRQTHDLGPGGSLTLQVTGTGSGSDAVPAGAVAAVLNVTVTQGTRAGVLTVYPAGLGSPPTSNLNWVKGETVPNLVTVPLSPGGAVGIVNRSAGAVDVVVDVEGYYAAPVSGAGQYAALPPARILDTRYGTGGIMGPIAGGQTIAVQVTGRGGVPASGVAAVVLNVTVTQTTRSGFLTAYPVGVARPTASNVNWVKGETVANRVMVPVGTNGQVALYNSYGDTQMVVDVSGYLTTQAVAAGTDGLFVPVAPHRLLDTRVTHQTLGPGQVLTVPVAGQAGVPASGATAAVMNVTVTDTTTAGYLTVYPAGVPRPTASDINWVKGETVPNMAVPRLGSGGAIAVYNSYGHTDVVIDVVGWFS